MHCVVQDPSVILPEKGEGYHLLVVTTFEKQLKQMNYGGKYKQNQNTDKYNLQMYKKKPEQLKSCYPEFK